MSRGLFRYDVTACETKVIPGEHGFIAQLNEGRHLKKRPTEFRVDCVLQPFDPAKFNFTKVGQEEVLFRFEASGSHKSSFSERAPVDGTKAPNVLAINVRGKYSVYLCWYFRCLNFRFFWIYYLSFSYLLFWKILSSPLRTYPTVLKNYGILCKLLLGIKLF